MADARRLSDDMRETRAMTRKVEQGEELKKALVVELLPHARVKVRQLVCGHDSIMTNKRFVNRTWYPVANEGICRDCVRRMSRRSKKFDVVPGEKTLEWAQQQFGRSR